MVRYSAPQTVEPYGPDKEAELQTSSIALRFPMPAHGQPWVLLGRFAVPSMVGSPGLLKRAARLKILILFL
jgi:hypothetical protein